MGRGVFLHLVLLLLSLFIPLSFLMFGLLGNPYGYVLFLHSPFIFLLCMLPLRDRFLEWDEIDLYAGVSSKLMFLPLLFLGLVAPLDNPIFNPLETYFWYMVMGSGYAYTLPFEMFLVYIPYSIYGFATGRWRPLYVVGDYLLLLSNLAILSLYIVLLYWRRRYREGVSKIIFVCGVIANLVLVFIFGFSISPLIHLFYLLVNLSILNYRYIHYL